MNDEHRTDAISDRQSARADRVVPCRQPAEIVGLLDGLTRGQARRGLVSSLTTLLGLVKHAALTERACFDVALAGRTRAEIGLPKTLDDSFILTNDDTIESALAQYRQAWTNAEEIAATYSMDNIAMQTRTTDSAAASSLSVRTLLSFSAATQFIAERGRGSQ